MVVATATTPAVAAPGDLAELARGPFPVPDPAVGRVNRTARRLALAMVGLVVIGLATGASGVASVQSRASLVDEVATRSGPLVVAAQDLYRSLSDADATAASAFLTEGPEPLELRARYRTDIALAGAALARASSGVHDGPAAAAVATISVQLPVYTGLVETGRAFNRQGLPVGAAYLREASGVMREQLLPAAERLFQAVSNQLDEARDGAAGFPWLTVLLGIVLVGGLLVVQMRLTRRTNRVLNLGLLGASGAALAALLWLGVSWSSAAGHLEASERDGSAQVALLSQARITALQARSDEAHTLVARGAGAAYEEDYQQVVGALSASLAEAREQATGGPVEETVDVATVAAGQWQEIHDEIRRLDDQEGEYPAAVSLAIGPEEDSAGSAFGRLDQALADGIGYGNDRFASEAARAGRALGGVGVGLGILTVVLVAGVVVGIQQRVMEYR
jgi:hypothetical protein